MRHYILALLFALCPSLAFAQKDAKIPDPDPVIHAFRWGPDCRLYFTQSIYIHSHIETPHGVKRLNAGGIWRFNPDKTELDIFARGWINSWGHAFDKYGQSLVTDGAGGEG